MDHMRSVFLALATASLIGACNPSQTSGPPANPLAGATLAGWSDVATEDINVPQGVTYNPSDVDGAIVAEIAGVPENATSTQKTGGVSVRLPDAFETQASGALILVTVRAFAAQEGTMLGVAYSTADVGNSGWYQFALTQAPTDYHFVYTVPAKRAGNGDYLGFRSYADGRVQVVGFRTEVLPRAPAAIAETPLRPTQEN